MTQDSRPTRRPYAKTAERRATIGRAALAVVRRRGHRALTTAEVAEEAGISEATMLYHFPTRDHLLVAALQASTDDQPQLVAGLFTDRTPGPDELAGVIARDAMRDDQVTHLFAALSAEATNPEHPAHAFFTEHYTTARGHMARMVRERQEQGLAHPDLDANAVARQMMGVWTGLQAQWLIDPAFDLAAEIEVAFRQLTGQAAVEAKQAIDDIMNRM